MKDSYIRDKNNTFWEVNKYYGVVINFNDKHQWIRRVDAKPETLEEFKKKSIVLVPRNIVEYYDKKQNKKVIKVFHGKMSASVYANFLGTINIQDLEKNKKFFKTQNYYDSISNWKDQFKILNPSILGKIVPS
ncbi:hypothetical protein [Spiroplasma endosymbiont of Polydrusus pterygomalis]|uniref:hypothetical protein n=1 Tax=Spiroplasma endosymbiont of Polydrusus pterygomalis TaxID=3139327 RepID=UPI003CCB4954